MFTNQKIMQIAMKQSATDLNSKETDFLEKENVIVKSGVGPLARKYYKEPIACNLAMEILEKGKVPFYCCAWSNIKSSRNAIKSGFIPAWVEMTVKPVEIVNEMNL